MNYETCFPIEPSRSAGGESIASSAESGKTNLVFSEASAQRIGSGESIASSAESGKLTWSFLRHPRSG